MTMKIRKRADPPNRPASAPIPISHPGHDCVLVHGQGMMAHSTKEEEC